MKRPFNRFAMAQARKAAGMSQSQLAKLVHRNRVSISDIERGKFVPSYDLICDIAEKLGVQVSQLLKLQSDRLEDLPIPENEKRLLAAFRGMSQTTQGIVLGFLISLSATDSADFDEAARRIRAASQ